MRTIKFRAWNSKKMSQPFTLFDISNDIDSGRTYFGNFKFYEGIDDDVIMQFTGLTDGNGKEIFEGDIVYDGHDKWIVRWCNSEAEFELNRIHNKDQIGVIHSCGMAEIMRIVGNIYENPELLT
jgi:hypothetical protein